MSDAFDEAELMDRLDNDLEFLREAVEMLDEDAPDLLRQIKEAAASSDAALLATSAHTLKGMLANFCAEPSESAARALEGLGRAGTLEQAPAAVSLVEQETDRLCAALRAFLEASPS